MTAETVNAIAKLTEAANPARRIVQAPGEPPGVYYVQQADGTLERVCAHLPRTDSLAADLDTLARVAGLYLEKGDGPNVTPRVWCSRKEIVAVLQPFVSGDSAPSDVCRLTLTPSPQMAALMEWDRAGRADIDQPQLIRLLRTLFSGCAPSDLLPAIRKVRTSRAAEVTAEQQQGRVSLGKSMIAEMSGTAAIPERVQFTIPVFAEFAVPVSASVWVEIDPDPEKERFTLIVHPGQIERAFAEAEDAIRNRLLALLGEGSPIQVFRGKP